MPTACVAAVITPTYNSGRFLPGCIESVRSQSLDTLHIIQDGLSTDGTDSILKSTPPERLIATREADDGQSDAVNRGMALVPASVKVLSWLNADERLAPSAMEQVKTFFDENPQVDVVYGDSVTIAIDDKVAVRPNPQHAYDWLVLRGFGTYVRSSSLFFRRAVLDAGDLWLDPSFRQAMDLELLLRLHRRGYRFGYMARYLSVFIEHEQQLTKKQGPLVAAHDYSRIPEVITNPVARRAIALRHALRRRVAYAVHHASRADSWDELGQHGLIDLI